MAGQIQIVVARPPNFDAVAAVFPEARKAGTVFSYHGKIYNPSNIKIGPALLAHEATHLERQGDDEQGVLDWWAAYLEDPVFRYNEELFAHRAEYRRFAELFGKSHWGKFLDAIAGRLSSPLYGGLVTKAQAKEAILAPKIKLKKGE